MGKIMGKSNCLVSVVVLTYGNYIGLTKTLETIMMQSCPIDMIIVSDDGSGIDFPSAVIDKKWGNIPIQWIHQKENLGTVKHMNLIAQMTKGKYIKFMSSGDAFADDDALSSLVTFAEVRNSMIATSDALVSSENLKHAFYRFPGEKRGKLLNMVSNDLFCTLAASNIISATATLYRRDFFCKLGGIDESYRLLEDWPTWLRLARQGFSIDYLNKTTVLYGLGGVSSKNINAYLAPALHKDMIQCYEKEIFPYVNRFPKAQQRIIQYRYDGLLAQSITDKMKRFIQYPLESSKDFIKYKIKKVMIGVSKWIK